MSALTEAERHTCTCHPEIVSMDVFPAASYEALLDVVRAVRERNAQLEERNRELQRRDDYVEACLV